MPGCFLSMVLIIRSREFSIRCSCGRPDQGISLDVTTAPFVTTTPPIAAEITASRNALLRGQSRVAQAAKLRSVARQRVKRRSRAAKLPDG